MPIDGSQVLISWHPRRRSPSHPLYILQTASGQLDSITLAGIASIIMREVYATIRESIYPNQSSLSKAFPEASGRLLRNPQEFTFQDRAN